MIGDPWTWSLPQLLQYFAPKIALAIFCGGMVGLERELKNKPAGIKTNMLICLGATLYTTMSILIAASYASTGHYGDPTRIAAQIVSGIGFLGGGTIIQARGTIQGLTTAATIWVVAALGVCIGMGHGEIAVLCSLTVILVLVGTTAFEDRVLGRSMSFACEVVIGDLTKNGKSLLQQSLAQNELVLNDFNLETRGKLTVFSVQYSGNRSNHKKFILELWDIPGIKEVKQS